MVVILTSMTQVYPMDYASQAEARLRRMPPFLTLRSQKESPPLSGRTASESSMATHEWAVASLGRPHELTPDSSPETSALRALRAVRILAEATRLLTSSCSPASGTVNQRSFGARGFAMHGETIREHARGGRPDSRAHLSAGPPRETSTHTTPCRKTAYARRKTRTPQP